MSDRDRHRARDGERERNRDRDRDRDREKRRDKEDRDRDRERDHERSRSKRSRSRTGSPDRSRSRHTRLRTRSPDHRSHRRNQQHHRGSLSPSPPPKRQRRIHDEEKHSHKAVADFVDGIAKEHLEKKENNSGGSGEGIEGGGDEDEIEMMKKLGIPVGFDSTKGKPVPGADVSGVRAVTKRQPRQYMNRRGGFNRPLPAERNR